MDQLRLAPAEVIQATLACSRCGDDSRAWDRVAAKSYCPNCLELLALGDSDPIVEPVESNRCAVCHHLGTVSYLTFPLHSRRPIETDLCAEHIRALVARRLGPHAFEQLRRQLTTLGINTHEVFLLHDAFYDFQGHAIQPVLNSYF